MNSRPPSIRRFAPLLLWAVASCARSHSGGFQMPPVPVEVAEVRSETVRDEFKALGTVEARETVKVVNEVAGVVRALPFAEGHPVVRGQLLARLDDREIGAEARRAEALRDQAHTQYERVKQLFDSQAASQQEMDDASSALKVAEANYALAQARHDKTRLVSPLSGVVGRRLVSPGAYLGVGDAVTEVASVDVMKVSFAAPERYLGRLRSGATVVVTTTAFPSEVFLGRIDVVDPILDPATRTFQVVARVPNPKRWLRPGMSADVSATLAERAHSLTVPDEAVFAQGDQSFVYVVKPDSTVARQPISIGSRDSSRVEVMGGLAAGQRVVRAGYQKLFDGAHVVPVPAGLGAGASGGSR
ncbi:MAG: efflux RND transporter periplasmic adaptor subunit [Candidatus Eisenbacteria bacterium]|uniref:Efflux RND transporter periplasmic adaptor subunit n=1 Tax=Eiseniibacteriota bacterium TaxID=2212470 RepID=A0A538TLX5_UNCEI|nr:MAG: efflux RND transporter periplasmic adaptor subunit [Candidatus Eisenbacteria bacterium]